MVCISEGVFPKTMSERKVFSENTLKNPDYVRECEAFENRIYHAKPTEQFETWFDYFQFVDNQLKNESSSIRSEVRGRLAQRICAHFEYVPEYANNTEYFKFWVISLNHKFKAEEDDKSRQRFAILEMLKRLGKMGIGTELPIFYQTFACYLECVHNFDMAERTLVQGIEKTGNAGLTKLFKEFQTRMQKRRAREVRRDEISNREKGEKLNYVPGQLANPTTFSMESMTTRMLTENFMGFSIEEIRAADYFRRLQHRTYTHEF